MPRFDRSIESLPKWAQREIQVLQQQNANLAAKLSAGPVGSDTFADPYQHPRPLGTSPTIRFGIDDEHGHDWINCRRLPDGGVDVMGANELSIVPRSGNRVVVRVIPR